MRRRGSPGKTCLTVARKWGRRITYSVKGRVVPALYLADSYRPINGLGSGRQAGRTAPVGASRPQSRALGRLGWSRTRSLRGGRRNPRARRRTAGLRCPVRPKWRASPLADFGRTFPNEIVPGALGDLAGVYVMPIIRLPNSVLQVGKPEDWRDRSLGGKLRRTLSIRRRTFPPRLLSPPHFADF